MNGADGLIARKGAILVKWGFEQYRSGFRRITRRSALHFESADWHGVQQDMVERLALYTNVVRRVVAALEDVFGEARRSPDLWSAMKREYSWLMGGHGDLELAETFFNSVTRKVFTTVGVDAKREFVHFGSDTGLPPPGAVPVRTYPGALSTCSVVHQVLDDYAFGIPWADYEGDAVLVACAMDEALTAAWGDTAFDFVELLEPVFYRNKGAYVVGRIVRGERFLPLVFALVNPDGRVAVDAVLLDEDEVSVVFSFTRSYFHVDVEAPAGIVRFMKSILPRKPVAELYVTLGYNKHGKTELYRDLLRHLERSGDRFETARGEKGMVMVVFTMPGYDVVFKVIRDRFGPAKTVTRAQVKERYQFVFEHDRAGRLVDIQEYEFLEFARDRFAPDILEELLAECSETVALQGDDVVIRHLYTERRVVPLNLFIREAPEEGVREAVLEFGRALRDLAATNIFPGDLLVKNFGVTRHGRVVFYDYDELCAVTDCDFRELPEEDDSGGGGGDGPSFYVGPRDAFPEEFLTFMGFPKPLRVLFADAHADLVRPEFWNDMKRRHAAGEVLDVFPYPPERRLQRPPVG
ncbi:MAG TPA: bifunctional isocitrate dehydrogenase kinase/phosphatase [Thermoanaerobaculia bacterium]|nr:bifunctional isocitrate dehydrogenase kinase/phosphatase [Thermoanaerobaculia bacterium]